MSGHLLRERGPARTHRGSTFKTLCEEAHRAHWISDRIALGKPKGKEVTDDAAKAQHSNTQHGAAAGRRLEARSPVGGAWLMECSDLFGIRDLIRRGMSVGNCDRVHRHLEFHRLAIGGWLLWITTIDGPVTGLKDLGRYIKVSSSKVGEAQGSTCSLSKAHARVTADITTDKEGMGFPP